PPRGGPRPSPSCATAALSEWLAAPEADPPDPADALRVAALRAQGAIATPPQGVPGPACTFAAAVVNGGWLTVGWLGDSRVYLLGADGGALRMTADDTLAAEAARAGLLPPEAAETGPGAHTITRWLGPGNADPVPRVASVPLTAPGRVVVCTDGLWNYVSAAAAVAARVADLPTRASALAVARHLTSVALRAGGRDNVTVVVMDLPGRA
ncbi:protein serine/threonine phosphatase 2C family protein, partial [Frankia sp. CN7]|uniref:PP2C family protein-serine/threonine phosphatase n=1 Tax=Frankia nepalensis TaxID=1836974 RepID=UPI001931CD53